MTELPVAVHLVADRPPLDAERLGVAVGCAQPAQRRVLRAVAVGELVGRHLGAAEAGVHRDVGLGVDQLAQAQELVQTHVVVLDPLPGGVLARRPAVAVADPVAPVVAADEVAARPAVDGRVQFAQQGEHVGPEAFDVVGRHQRDNSHVQPVPAADRDLQPAVVGRGSGGEAQRYLLPGGGNAVDVQGLPVGGAVTPDQADGNRCGAGIAAQHDPPFVALPGHQPQARLDESGGLGLRCRTEGRRLGADVGRRTVHGQRGGVAEDAPGRLLAGRRVEELPVLEHLGPDAAVDAAAQVLDELAVDVLRDRLAGAGRVDRSLGANLTCGEQLDGEIVEPGPAGRFAPTAEQAVDLDGVVGARVELEGDLRPIVGAGERRGAGTLHPVQVEQRAPARGRGQLLGADPAGQPVAGERSHRHDRAPGEVAPLAGGDGHAATAGPADLGVPELATAAPAVGAPLGGSLGRSLGVWGLERRVRNFRGRRLGRAAGGRREKQDARCTRDAPRTGADSLHGSPHWIRHSCIPPAQPSCELISSRTARVRTVSKTTRFQAFFSTPYSSSVQTGFQTPSSR